MNTPSEARTSTRFAQSLIAQLLLSGDAHLSEGCPASLTCSACAVRASKARVWYCFEHLLCFSQVLPGSFPGALACACLQARRKQPP